MRHTHIYTKYTEGNSTRLVCACDVALTVTYKGAVMVDDDTEPEEGAGIEWMAVDPAWIALLGTIFGGIGLKAAENWMGRHRSKVDDAKNIRDELRLQDAAQKEEIKELEDSVDKWRGEYYDLRDKYTTMQTELTIALHELKKRADEVIEQELKQKEKDNERKR